MPPRVSPASVLLTTAAADASSRDSHFPRRKPPAIESAGSPPEDATVLQDGQHTPMSFTKMVLSIIRGNMPTRTGFLRWFKGSSALPKGLQPCGGLAIDNALFNCYVAECDTVKHASSKKRRKCGNIGSQMKTDLRNVLASDGMKVRNIQFAGGGLKRVTDPALLGYLRRNKLIKGDPAEYTGDKGNCAVYRQALKVPMPDLDAEKVIALVHSGVFSRFGYFLKDIDGAGDCRGVVGDKDQAIELLKQLGFEMQSESSFMSPNGFAAWLAGGRRGTILANCFKVGKNCLTIRTTYKGHDVRVKFYNKTIFMIEKGSMCDQVGHNLTALIESSANQSRVAGCKEDSVGHGYTRVEITWYLDDPSIHRPDRAHLAVPSADEMSKTLSHFARLMPAKVVRRCPHSLLMRNWMDALTGALVIVDTLRNRAVLCYSYNELTDSVAGQWIQEWSKNCTWVLTFNTLGNLPTRIVNVHRRADDPGVLMEDQTEAEVGPLATTSATSNMPRFRGETTLPSGSSARLASESTPSQPTVADSAQTTLDRFLLAPVQSSPHTAADIGHDASDSVTNQDGPTSVHLGAPVGSGEAADADQPVAEPTHLSAQDAAETQQPEEELDALQTSEYRLVRYEPDVGAVAFTQDVLLRVPITMRDVSAARDHVCTTTFLRGGTGHEECSGATLRHAFLPEQGNYVERLESYFALMKGAPYGQHEPLPRGVADIVAETQAGADQGSDAAPAQSTSAPSEKTERKRKARSQAAENDQGDHDQWLPLRSAKQIKLSRECADLWATSAPPYQAFTESFRRAGLDVYTVGSTAEAKALRLGVERVSLVLAEDGSTEGVQEDNRWFAQSCALLHCPSSPGISSSHDGSGTDDGGMAVDSSTAAQNDQTTHTAFYLNPCVEASVACANRALLQMVVDSSAGAIRCNFGSNSCRPPRGDNDITQQHSFLQVIGYWVERMLSKAVSDAPYVTSTQMRSAESATQSMERHRGGGGGSGEPSDVVVVEQEEEEELMALAAEDDEDEQDSLMDAEEGVIQQQDDSAELVSGTELTTAVRAEPLACHAESPRVESPHQPQAEAPASTDPLSVCHVLSATVPGCKELPVGAFTQLLKRSDIAYNFVSDPQQVRTDIQSSVAPSKAAFYLMERKPPQAQDDASDGAHQTAWVGLRVGGKHPPLWIDPTGSQERVFCGDLASELMVWFASHADFKPQPHSAFLASNPSTWCNAAPVGYEKHKGQAICVLDIQKAVLYALAGHLGIFNKLQAKVSVIGLSLTAPAQKGVIQAVPDPERRLDESEKKPRPSVKSNKVLDTQRSYTIDDLVDLQLMFAGVHTVQHSGQSVLNIRLNKTTPRETEPLPYKIIRTNTQAPQLFLWQIHASRKERELAARLNLKEIRKKRCIRLGGALPRGEKQSTENKMLVIKAALETAAKARPELVETFVLENAKRMFAEHLLDQFGTARNAQKWNSLEVGTYPLLALKERKLANVTDDRVGFVYFLRIAGKITIVHAPAAVSAALTEERQGDVLSVLMHEIEGAIFYFAEAADESPIGEVKVAIDRPQEVRIGGITMSAPPRAPEQMSDASTDMEVEQDTSAEAAPSVVQEDTQPLANLGYLKYDLRNDPHTALVLQNTKSLIDFQVQPGSLFDITGYGVADYKTKDRRFFRVRHGDNESHVWAGPLCKGYCQHNAVHHLCSECRDSAYQWNDNSVRPGDKLRITTLTKQAANAFVLRGSDWHLFADYDDLPVLQRAKQNPVESVRIKDVRYVRRKALAVVKTDSSVRWAPQPIVLADTGDVVYRFSGSIATLDLKRGKTLDCNTWKTS